MSIFHCHEYIYMCVCVLHLKKAFGHKHIGFTTNQGTRLGFTGPKVTRYPLK